MQKSNAGFYRHCFFAYRQFGNLICRLNFVPYFKNRKKHQTKNDH